MMAFCKHIPGHICFVIGFAVSSFLFVKCCEEDSRVGPPDIASIDQNLDDNVGNVYVMASQAYAFNCCGTIKTLQMHLGRQGDVQFLTWRPEQGTGNLQLISKTTVPAQTSDGLYTLPLVSNQRPSVQPGDFIGWYASGRDVIPFNAVPKNAVLFMPMQGGLPAVGTIIDWSAANFNDSRMYGVAAIMSPNTSPSITNLDETTNASANATDGTTVFTIIVSDADRFDVPSLVVKLESEGNYFKLQQIGNGNRFNVLVRNALEERVYEIQISVTDPCGARSTGTLTVVVGDPSAEPESEPEAEGEDIGDAWKIGIGVVLASVAIVVGAILAFKLWQWHRKKHSTMPGKDEKIPEQNGTPGKDGGKRSVP